ncbi:hypothetical protein BCV69DRAFT_214060 [Microstroma glucosiphilum]|uniref:Uncharacterized protein n=1 Tax=Pseudomicrostroma glucosiphilum TaxID=1684307 RepID=A0A316U6I8_9BASI|nr:hypothetical protein BCV69DRAFT_214060 [Pseudomicrostroma glucosiphilum]PWN19953.1 hypothetical protein BCV69DRAFT_214060 [Pseudomicrostroma glucosiphilum]
MTPFRFEPSPPPWLTAQAPKVPMRTVSRLTGLLDSDLDPNREREHSPDELHSSQEDRNCGGVAHSVTQKVGNRPVVARRSATARGRSKRTLSSARSLTLTADAEAAARKMDSLPEDITSTDDCSGSRSIPSSRQKRRLELHTNSNDRIPAPALGQEVRCVCI